VNPPIIITRRCVNVEYQRIRVVERGEVFDMSFERKHSYYVYTVYLLHNKQIVKSYYLLEIIIYIYVGSLGLGRVFLIKGRFGYGVYTLQTCERAINDVIARGRSLRINVKYI